MRIMFQQLSSRVKSYLQPGGRRPPRVLVVDDETRILGFVSRVLEPVGYEVFTADSGAGALAVTAEHGPFDALITDLVMPNMNGDELARRMRATAPDLKVLYLTGFTDQLFREKVTLWSDEAFLDKPTSIDGLQQAIAMLLYGRVFGAPSPSPSLQRTKRPRAALRE